MFRNAQWARDIIKPSCLLWYSKYIFILEERPDLCDFTVALMSGIDVVLLKLARSLLTIH